MLLSDYLGISGCSRCCLLDFSFVVGDASIASLTIFDMLLLEPFSDRFEGSVMLIRRMVQVVQS